jgi:hypothetical protein
MNDFPFKKKLNSCKDYGDIFELVKRAVKQQIGRERAGLMLYLGNLPLNIGAYHGVGTNGIVLNKSLLRVINFRTLTELNSYVFMILLHEYLHSLGYLDEKQVRRLTHDISREIFGDKHPAVQYAVRFPVPKVTAPQMQSFNQDIELEIIKDFDRSSVSYIK